jgi:N12 class adenine-specific DNA methylase
MDDHRFQANVQALTEVIPPDLRAPAPARRAVSCPWVPGTVRRDRG